jgi:chromosome segregation ATPase
MVHLRHQLSVSRCRENELKVELEESEILRKQSSSGMRSLRDSEDKFMREERLKDELARSKQQRLDLEASLLDRDSRAMENKFDLETRDHELERFKRRIKELEIAYRGAVATSGSGHKETRSHLGNNIDDIGSKFSREKDLEGVVEAMKKVVDKLKSENDRLRKGSVDDRKLGDVEKRATNEKKRAEKLDEEMKSLQSKLKGYEESSQKLTQKSQQVTGLRKSLKLREDEILVFREQAERAINEKENLNKKINKLTTQVSQLELSLAQLSSKGLKGNNDQHSKQELADLKNKFAIQAVEIEQLRSQSAELRQKNKQLNDQNSGNNGGNSSRSRVNNDVNLNEFNQLKVENDKLRAELSAFDMDFFDEIENLKYAHAEAIKKLKVYEGTALASRNR